MENILISGGAGFIGSNLALKLVNLGYNVRVLDNLSPQIHTNSKENSQLYQSIKGKVGKRLLPIVLLLYTWQQKLVQVSPCIKLKNMCK